MTYRVSKHASVRMQERGLTHQDVNTAITYGNKLVNKWDSNKVTIVDNKTRVTVVMDKAMTVVITLFIQGVK